MLNSSGSVTGRRTWRGFSGSRITGWSILLIATFALAACDNMQHQRGAKDVARRSSTDAIVRRPPAFTVARGSPLPGDPRMTGFQDGKLLEKNPLPLTAERLRQGRDRFTIYCAVCHGDDGYGAGIVVRRGFPAPPSYHEERLRDAPDGHLFDVITRGYGAMLPFADRLTTDERWAVVAYVRALQRSQRVAWSELPPADQAHFPPP
jgi:mono/diheme cytochrome c family protein